MEVCLLREIGNPFVPHIAEVFENIESYLEKYFVKTDCIKFFEHYFERNPTYVNFIIEGVRGSGKTSCLWYLEKLLSNNEKNLTIYYKVSFYPSLMYDYSKLFNNDYFIFLLPFYRALFHSFYKLNTKEVEKRENRIESFFSFNPLEHPVEERFDDLQKYILHDIFTILKRMSKDYSRVIFLIDDIDKFPFSSLKNISTRIGANNIVLSRPKSIEVSFICAANPTISSELSSLLRIFAQKEAVIVDVNWDIGYSTEVIRRRIENVTEKRLRDYLDDHKLFALHEGSDKNPRHILSILSRLWETALERKGHMSSFDINNIIKEWKEKSLLIEDEISIENEFKLKFKPYWERILAAKTKQDKGKALEALLSRLFERVDGLGIVDTNVRTASEELDILIVNEAKDPFLGNLGTPILVECKKWNCPVGAREVSWFVSKVKRRSLKVGIFVAWEGITGNEYRDANLEIKRALEEGITIVVVTKDQLMKVYSPRDFLCMLKDCYYGVYKL